MCSCPTELWLLTLLCAWLLALHRPLIAEQFPLFLREAQHMTPSCASLARCAHAFDDTALTLEIQMEGTHTHTCNDHDWKARLNETGEGTKHAWSSFASPCETTGPQCCGTSEYNIHARCDVTNSIPAPSCCPTRKAKHEPPKDTQAVSVREWRDTIRHHEREVGCKLHLNRREPSNCQSL